MTVTGLCTVTVSILSLHNTNSVTSIRFPSGVLPNDKVAISCIFTFPLHNDYGGKRAHTSNPLGNNCPLLRRFSASCHFRNTYCFFLLNMNANAGVRGSTVVAVLLTLLGVQVKRQRFKIPPWFIRYCSFVLVNNLLSHANYTTELVNNKTT